MYFLAFLIKAKCLTVSQIASDDICCVILPFKSRWTYIYIVNRFISMHASFSVCHVVSWMSNMAGPMSSILWWGDWHICSLGPHTCTKEVWKPWVVTIPSRIFCLFFFLSLPGIQRNQGKGLSDIRNYSILTVVKVKSSDLNIPQNNTNNPENVSSEFQNPP